MVEVSSRRTIKIFDMIYSNLFIEHHSKSLNYDCLNISVFLPFNYNLNSGIGRETDLSKS